MTSEELRQQLRDALAAADAQRAIAAAQRLLNAQATLRQVSFVHSLLQTAPLADLGLKRIDLALLSSFSIEFLQPYVVALGFAEGFDVRIYQPGFAQFRQEMLNPASALYTFDPDIVFLAIEGRDFLPGVYDGYIDLLNRPKDELAQAEDELIQLLNAFRSRSAATIVVHNFAPPASFDLGILDGSIDVGQAELVHDLNRRLRVKTREVPATYVLDYASLVTRHGSSQWYDRRMQHYAKAPIASAMLGNLAQEYLKYVRAAAGKSRKCLVLDLDNTLWGGVLGEDGVSGIALGPHYPGSAYVDFQRTVLTLKKRGVMLAVASKNNPADVEEVFNSHSHMVLKTSDFLALQIHWRPKAESLREIAASLNIGLEHMVFVDDNPVECEQVAAALPMVTVLQLPHEPEKFPQALLEKGWFDTLSFSAEDQNRAALYHQRGEAEQLRQQFTSIEDFYVSLATELTFRPVDDASIARAAQLTQKTNQFNATTRRYTEAELRQRIQDPSWVVTTVKAVDRFGDNGIVGLMMARATGDELEIDTFLLSCRVIGRTIETAMLAHLCDAAQGRELKQLHGIIVPSAKNAPVRDLFERHGFSLVGDSDGASHWLLPFASNSVAYPSWITITVAEMKVTAGQ